MNRAERRRQEKAEKKKTATLNLTADQFEQFKREQSRRTAFTALTLMLGIPLMVLRDHHGFGKKRLETFVENCIELFDSFDKGYFTFEDIQKTIYKETGVKITETADKYYFEKGSEIKWTKN